MVVEYMTLTVAASVIASIKNGMDAIKAWQEIGDKRAARTAAGKKLAEASRERMMREPEVLQEAQELSLLIPEGVLRTFQERTDRCWERYETMMRSPDYLSGELDEATLAVIACVCRELNRLYEVNREMPQGKLQEYWSKYACSSRSRN
ncbi:hypothetical protein I2I11_20310 [Pontibacter sp. 172403-2]|uniref:hypothetical protein n=1 Tax=Pontibacter rufus TaxID=2791028 RepID=UPI0018AFCDBF|nr:hypothetical protein [Pontibacter sp. 172403-2]MBF9255652.1 hypothetical protein [Pontibacter sp. 172403-2]